MRMRRIGVKKIVSYPVAVIYNLFLLIKIIPAMSSDDSRPIYASLFAILGAASSMSFSGK